MGLERTYSTQRQRPLTFRITATFAMNVLGGSEIDFTITVPFGYFAPDLRLLV